MSWHYILLPTYFFLACWLIPRLRIFQESSISIRGWQAFLFLKCIVGYLYSQYHIAYIEGGDTWTFFYESGIYFQAFKESPWLFFKMILGPSGFRPIPDGFEPYVDASKYWWDSSQFLLIRFHAFLRLFTFGNYYVHVIIWNFLSIIGLAGILHFMQDRVDRPGILSLIALFLPSILFWASGAHKEGISFFLLGLVVYKLGADKNTSFFLKIGIISVALFLLAIMRVYLALLFLPALIAFLWTERFPGRTFLKFLTVYLLCFLFTLIAPLIHPRLDFYYEISEMLRVMKFYFVGNATLETPSFTADEWWHFYLNVPKYLYNTMLMPNWVDSSVWYRFLAFLETYFIALMIVLSFFFLRWKQLLNDNRSLMAIFFALSLLVIIGAVSVNYGATVRYRTVAYIFLLLGFARHLKWLKATA